MKTENEHIKGNIKEGTAEKKNRKEMKEFKFTGVKKHLGALKECNNKIKEIEEKIVQTKERVDQRIEEFRKLTGKKELYDTRTELQEKVKTLKNEKNEMISELSKVNQELKELSQSVGEEKKKLNMKSTVELRNQLNSIDNRIRERPMSSREEKEISAEKNRIIKLLSMQDMFKEKDEKIKEMDDKKKTKEKLLSIKKQEIENTLKSLTDINNRIGSLSKVSYPADITKMQESINALIKEKKTYMAARKEAFAVMEQKSREYELKAAEIEKAKQHKNDLIAQEKVISDLFHEKEKIELDLQGNPCEQLKTLKTALIQYKNSLDKGVKTTLLIPFHIVAHLVKFNIAIPKESSDIEKTIKKINEIAVSEEKNFLEKKNRMNDHIKEISSRIAQEKEKLGKMPKPVFPRFSE
ncbi:hypothetical protein NEOKW01_1911 [Nematocida sp. AWRm80]|nr:hypothetical protein NEOKW01_1911 [Nematocida sp. AWRm80]